MARQLPVTHPCLPPARTPTTALLVELLVVLVILGVLSAIAIEGLGHLKGEAVRIACEADVKATSSAAELYRVGHARYPDAVATLRTEGYISGAASSEHSLDYRLSQDGQSYSLTGLLDGGDVCASSLGG